MSNVKTCVVIGYFTMESGDSGRIFESAEFGGNMQYETAHDFIEDVKKTYRGRVREWVIKQVVIG
jgi:hypothetical protein